MELLNNIGFNKDYKHESLRKIQLYVCVCVCVCQRNSSTKTLESAVA